MFSQEPETEGEKQSMIIVRLEGEKVLKLEVTTKYFLHSEKGLLFIEAYIKELYAIFPKFFTSEKKLREIWSNPSTRKSFLASLANEGFSLETLIALQKSINDKSDIFDILRYFAYQVPPKDREERVNYVRNNWVKTLDKEEKELVDFLLDSYLKNGINELEEPPKHKYGRVDDIENKFESINSFNEIFLHTQEEIFSS